MDFSNSKFESKNSNKPSKRRKKHTKMEIKIDPNSLLPSDIGRRFGDKIISLMTEADIEQRYKTCGILIFSIIPHSTSPPDLNLLGINLLLLIRALFQFVPPSAFRRFQMMLGPPSCEKFLPPFVIS